MPNSFLRTRDREIPGENVVIDLQEGEVRMDGACGEDVQEGLTDLQYLELEEYPTIIDSAGKVLGGAVDESDPRE